MRTEEPKTIHLKDYRPPAYRIEEVHLTFHLDPARTRVRAEMKVAADGDEGGPFHLHGDDLPLLAIALDGAPLAETAYTHDTYRITPTETGYRWEDKHGKWKAYDPKGRMTAYGNRNGIQGALIYEQGENGKPRSR